MVESIVITHWKCNLTFGCLFDWVNIGCNLIHQCLNQILPSYPCWNDVMCPVRCEVLGMMSLDQRVFLSPLPASRWSSDDESMAAVCLCVWHCDVCRPGPLSPPPLSHCLTSCLSGISDRAHRPDQKIKKWGILVLAIDFHWGHF
jgi:hypothetical protein